MCLLVQAYVSVFHMATMAAGVELATAMGDASTASSCSTALAAAKKSFDLLQWNSTKNGYDAGSKGCTKDQGCTTGVGLFADSFYAQVLSFSAGLGLLVDKERLQSHLATQLKRGCVHYDIGSTTPKPGCPNGMIVLTGRAEDGDKTGGCDLQVWEMAPPNHASLGIHLGLDVQEMLAVFEPSATSWSQRINNQWSVFVPTALPDLLGDDASLAFGSVPQGYCWHQGHERVRHRNQSLRHAQ